MNKNRLLKLLCALTNHIWVYDYDSFEYQRYCKKCNHKQRKKHEYKDTYWHYTSEFIWENI